MNKNRIGIAALLAACGPILAGSYSAAAETTMVSPSGYFEFHISPWIALHHFAYHYVREEERDLKLRGDVPLIKADKQAITPEFRSACASLKTAYRPYIEGSLLHDERTRGLTRELWSGPDAVTDKAVQDALFACMPAYERTLWPAHQAASRELLTALMIQLESYEGEMADALAKSLESEWPGDPIRVDITAYANWAGAYTDDRPPNVTISSYDETVSAYAFEILFHESAHTGAFSESLDAVSAAAMKRAGLTNDRFWHYILFFVTGRVVAKVLDDPDYLPYSKAVGLTEKRSAAPFYAALEESWDQRSSYQERVNLAASIVGNEGD